MDALTDEVGHQEKFMRCNWIQCSFVLDRCPCRVAEHHSQSSALCL